MDEWLLDNIEVILTVLFLLLAVVITNKKLGYWRWANEVGWFGWVTAEKEGLVQGLKGYAKYKIFAETWRAKYLAKWGKEPTESQVAAAKVLAEKLSAQEKTLRLDPQ